MNQGTIIQIASLLIIIILTLFINPLQADYQGKILFFGIVIMLVIFYVVFDLYKKIDDNKRRIILFNEKMNLHERIKDLESLTKK